ncbi:MAG: thioredoxin family protein [Desulfobulbaceae bacterium]|nr:thioredoxin family protein [Desulfofustis sp.]RZW26788.1 MAG: thioredoxin family protein [Desulfobulbaceae bacterium]
MVSIQIAAPPGSLCKQTEQCIAQLIEDQGLDCSVELVHDFDTIIELGVYAIPGLLIDGTLKSVGRVPEIHELIDWLGLGQAP